MQIITLNCNLEILKKYSNKADFLLKQRNVKSLSKTECLIEFNINKSGTSGHPDFYKLFSSVATSHYFKEEKLAASHLPNIFFLLDELNQELYAPGTELLDSQLTEYFKAKECLNFLHNLLQIKEGGLNNTVVKLYNINTSVNVSANVSDDKLINGNLINEMINYFKQVRLTNEILFSWIEPCDFNLKKVSEIIKINNETQPKEIYTIKFKVEHYAVLLIKYLNNEVELNNKSATSNAKQQRLLFELFSLFNLSDFIIEPDEMPDLTHLKERKKLITQKTKKFIENHCISKNFDYSKKFDELI